MAKAETRADVIRKSFERYYALDRQIKEIIEENVADLRQQKSEITDKLRDEFNMPTKLFRARYAAYKLEQAAHDGDDSVTLDAIREMYAVMPVGGQVDWVAADEAKQPGAEMAKRLDEAEAEGLAAGKMGASAESCPFPETSELFARWRAGWAKAKPRRRRGHRDAVEDLAAAEGAGNA